MGSRRVAGAPTAYIVTELRAELARQRLSQRDLAALAGMPAGTVFRVLSGTTAIATDSLIDVCDALGIDPGALIREAAKLRKPRTEATS